jgi:hypothetical protein
MDKAMDNGVYKDTDKGMDYGMSKGMDKGKGIRVG